MKIIDLLNKIANGEEVPKKIRITDIDDRITRHYNFFYDEDEQEYKDDELFPLGARLILDRVLNKKVEILDKIEERKITPTDFENLGYALGSIQKYINKGYDKAIEEKKIPEKLDTLTYTNRNTTSIWNEHRDKINEIIDYLKSKGE